MLTLWKEGDDAVGSAERAEVILQRSTCCISKRLPRPTLEPEKGAYSVPHPGGPADAGSSWLAQSCHLPGEPGKEKKGNQDTSGYGGAVLCMKVSNRLKA